MRMERSGGAIIFRYSKSEEEQFLGNILKSLDEKLRLMESRISKLERLLLPSITAVPRCSSEIMESQRRYI